MPIKRNIVFRFHESISNTPSHIQMEMKHRFSISMPPDLALIGFSDEAIYIHAKQY